MKQSPELLAAHQARRETVDPLLAAAQPLPDPLETDTELSCPGGAALMRNSAADPESWGYTFFAAHESRLLPQVDGPRAFAELLDLWAAQDAFRPGPDSIATITWPSRDTEMSRALVERGFAQQSIFAVRLAPPSAGDGAAAAASPAAADAADAGGVVIRHAGPEDTATVTRLWLEQLHWDARFGYLAIRPSTPARLADEVAEAVGGEEKRAWIAERDGEAVGLMVVQPPEHAGWAANTIRAERPVAYLNCGAVSAGERGGGVGRALARHVHAELDAEGHGAVLLHYTAANPLSGPFWHRCGYRPLLTTWTRGTVG
ncbi:GCN5-related N-acetyltransferase [Catenulispora acidiphila DSM 44928]|uniref:GCN5-related N-acetyltransferase n=1 Tax=Catenulispora acidiphila (strain DSM 44928 / JCM 14897 / NBRC 102108 / NRRL B-24433 / ID139908) TaxID=479433 RepID=C7Q9B3_CATAD|nr:GNAT family N-acetyltransferase [Catenulispora acidiphila]ACU74259.1 GCN5-related N-acetyltransferase [Catenulispora acidiphila DSM 44928]